MLKGKQDLFVWISLCDCSCAETGEHLASEAQKTFDDIVGAESGTTDSIILRMKRILKVVKIKAEGTYQN